MQPAGGFEEFAGAGAVGGADKAVALHEVDQMGGAAVADAEASLEERGGGFAEFEDQADGVVEQGVVFVGVGVGAIDGDALVFGRFEEGMDVFGISLRPPEADHGRSLRFGDQGRVEAHETAGAGGEE